MCAIGLSFFGMSNSLWPLSTNCPMYVFTAQPTSQPSLQPSSHPSTPTEDEVGKFWGFNDYDYCPPDCYSGTYYGDPTAIGTNGWSTDTGGVYVICPVCAWYNAVFPHPTFGLYSGNYIFLTKTLPNHGAWDARLTRTFNGLTPGSSYNVVFWQQQRDAGYLTTWSVSLGGTVVYSTLPESYPQYINSASVVATSTSLTVVFEATSTVNDYRSVWLNGVTLESSISPLTTIPTVSPSISPSTVNPPFNPSMPSSLQPTSRSSMQLYETFNECITGLKISGDCFCNGWTSYGDPSLIQAGTTVVYGIWIVPSGVWIGIPQSYPAGLDNAIFMQQPGPDESFAHWDVSMDKTYSGVSPFTLYSLQFWMTTQNSGIPPATFTVSLGGNVVYSTLPLGYEWSQATTASFCAPSSSLVVEFRATANGIASAMAVAGINLVAGERCTMKPSSEPSMIFRPNANILSPSGQPTRQPSQRPSCEFFSH